MRPTRPRVLVLWAALGVIVGYLLVSVAYGDLPPLPRFAPVTLAALAAAELAVARGIRDRIRGRPRPRARPLHPLQVARAAALAKASSPVGSLFAGGYAGLLLWLLPRQAAAVRRDALTSALSLACALALVAAALLLERACRTPESHDEQHGLGSRT